MTVSFGGGSDKIVKAAAPIVVAAGAGAAGTVATGAAAVGAAAVAAAPFVVPAVILSGIGYGIYKLCKGK